MNKKLIFGAAALTAAVTVNTTETWAAEEGLVAQSAQADAVATAQANVQTAQTGLQSAQANVQTAQTGVQSAQTAVTTNTANVSAKQQALSAAQNSVDEQKQKENNLTSAQTAVTNATNKVNEAKTALANAQHNEEQQNIQNQIKAKEQEIERLKSQTTNTPAKLADFKTTDNWFSEADIQRWNHKEREQAVGAAKFYQSQVTNKFQQGISRDYIETDDVKLRDLVHNNQVVIDHWRIDNDLEDNIEGDGSDEEDARRTQAVISKYNNQATKLQTMGSQLKPAYVSGPDDGKKYQVNNLPQDVIIDLSTYAATIYKNFMNASWTYNQTAPASQKWAKQNTARVTKNAVNFADDVAKAAAGAQVNSERDFGKVIDPFVAKYGLVNKADTDLLYGEGWDNEDISSLNKIDLLNAKYYDEYLRYDLGYARMFKSGDNYGEKTLDELRRLVHEAIVDEIYNASRDYFVTDHTRLRTKSRDVGVAFYNNNGKVSVVLTSINVDDTVADNYHIGGNTATFKAGDIELSNPTKDNTDEIKRLENDPALAQLRSQVKPLKAAPTLATAQANLKNAEDELDKAKNALATVQTALANHKVLNVDDAERDLREAEQKLKDAEDVLAKAKANLRDAENKLREAEQNLRDRETDLLNAQRLAQATNTPVPTSPVATPPVTTKGPGATEPVKPTLTIPAVPAPPVTTKGPGVTEPVKPTLTIPTVPTPPVTTKGPGVTEPVKPTLTIPAVPAPPVTTKGPGATEPVKPTLTIPPVPTPVPTSPVTTKGPGVTEPVKPTITIPTVPVTPTKPQGVEPVTPKGNPIQTKGNSGVNNKVTTTQTSKALPKTSASNEANSSSLPAALASILVAAGLLTRRKENK